jgi:hypothetical protein
VNRSGRVKEGRKGIGGEGNKDVQGGRLCQLSITYKNDADSNAAI